MQGSLPGSSVHGISQARMLEWVAISFSGGSSRPRDRTQVSHIAGRHFNLCSIREALKYHKLDGLNNRHLFLIILEVKKSKIKI